MPDISKHPLLKECYDLCLAIEKCAASPDLTDAGMKASNLMRGIETLVIDTCSVEELDAEINRIPEVKPLTEEPVYLHPAKPLDIHQSCKARIAGLEAHIETLNGWRETDLNAAMNYIETIQGLQSGLREVYALAGEDRQLSKIINTTLERYQIGRAHV